ncbi:unnamed protein product [Adineta ricciae]|uniref:Uncharacterized protein n=1 Tax=Adineta ricciae TaxID=249248 RepID=A0A815CYF7_ADIRI|nr:unnamed protein product [Adineta ricciae]
MKASPVILQNDDSYDYGIQEVDSGAISVNHNLYSSSNGLLVGASVATRTPLLPSTVVLDNQLESCVRIRSTLVDLRNNVRQHSDEENSPISTFYDIGIDVVDANEGIIETMKHGAQLQRTISDKQLYRLEAYVLRVILSLTLTSIFKYFSGKLNPEEQSQLAGNMNGMCNGLAKTHVALKKAAHRVFSSIGENMKKDATLNSDSIAAQSLHELQCSNSTLQSLPITPTAIPSVINTLVSMNSQLSTIESRIDSYEQNSSTRQDVPSHNPPTDGSSPSEDGIRHDNSGPSSYTSSESTKRQIRWYRNTIQIFIKLIKTMQAIFRRQ